MKNATVTVFMAAKRPTVDQPANHTIAQQYSYVDHQTHSHAAVAFVVVGILSKHSISPLLFYRCMSENMNRYEPDLFFHDII